MMSFSFFADASHEKRLAFSYPLMYQLFPAYPIH